MCRHTQSTHNLLNCRNTVACTYPPSPPRPPYSVHVNDTPTKLCGPWNNCKLCPPFVLIRKPLSLWHCWLIFCTKLMLLFPQGFILRGHRNASKHPCSTDPWKTFRVRATSAMKNTDNKLHLYAEKWTIFFNLSNKQKNRSIDAA
jgi:hypothetical protein